MGSEWVVAAGWLNANRRLSLRRCRPRVVGARSCGLLFLNGLLWLLLLLLLLAKAIHLLCPWIVGVLWLDELSLRLLHGIEAGLLRLLLLESIATVSILEASLLRLQSCGLVVRIVQETSLLRLLLLHRVTEPVDCSLLLVALIEASRLGSLCRSIVEKQVGLLLVVLLALAQLFLLSAEFECLCKIVVVILVALRPSFRGLVGFVLACLKRQAVFEVVVIVVAVALAPLSLRGRGLALVAAHRAHIFEPGDARLP